MKHGTRRWGLTLVLAGLAGQALAFGLGERVACQRAVERVLWQHRSGATPHLGFEQAMPERLIRRRAQDVERQSQALAQWWRTPIGPAELQAELDRKSTRLNSSHSQQSRMPSSA